MRFKVSEFLEWLPEFDLVAVRIVDPRKTTVIGIFALGIDLNSFSGQFGEETVHVVDTKVEHEG